jgi:hypothetical protein
MIKNNGKEILVQIIIEKKNYISYWQWVHGITLVYPTKVTQNVIIKIQISDESLQINHWIKFYISFLNSSKSVDNTVDASYYTGFTVRQCLTSNELRLHFLIPDYFCPFSNFFIKLGNLTKKKHGSFERIGSYSEQMEFYSSMNVVTTIISALKWIPYRCFSIKERS